MRTIRSHLSDPSASRDHGLRCAFRALARQGFVGLRHYPAFVELSDRAGIAAAYEAVVLGLRLPDPGPGVAARGHGAAA